MKSSIVKETTLTPLQLGMLFHIIEDPSSGTFISQSISYVDRLRPDIYDRAWNYLISRHEILRAAVHVNENLEDSRLLFFGESSIKGRIVSLLDKSPSRQNDAIRSLQNEERNVGFNLANSPLLRLVYIQLTDSKWAILNTHSHLILDGWSGGILGKELAETYEKLKRGSLPEFAQPRQFTDYIDWLDQREKDLDLRYWRNKLSSISSNTPLPWEPPRSHQNRNRTVESCSEKLTSQDSAAIELYAKNNKVTVNVLVEAAWSYLLSQYAGTDSILYGLVVSGRPHSLSGVESIVGMFLNTVPVHVQLNPDESVVQFIKRLQDERYDSQEYEHTPLISIKAESKIKTNFNLFNSVVARKDVSQEGRVGLRSRRAGSNRKRSSQSTFKQNFPFLLNIQLTDGIELKLTFHKGFIQKSHALLLLRQLSYVICQFCESPENNLVSIRLDSEVHTLSSFTKTHPSLYSDDGKLAPFLLNHNSFDVSAISTFLLECPESLAAQISVVGRSDHSANVSSYITDLKSRFSAAISSLVDDCSGQYKCLPNWLVAPDLDQSPDYLLLCGDQPFIEASLLLHSYRKGAQVTIAYLSETGENLESILDISHHKSIILTQSILYRLCSLSLMEQIQATNWVCVGRSPLTYSVSEAFKANQPDSHLQVVTLDRAGFPLLIWDNFQDEISFNEVIFGRPFAGQQTLLVNRYNQIASLGVSADLYRYNYESSDVYSQKILVNNQALYYSKSPELSYVGQNSDGIVIGLSTYRSRIGSIQSSSQLALFEALIREIVQIKDIYIACNEQDEWFLCLNIAHRDNLAEIIGSVNGLSAAEYQVQKVCLFKCLYYTSNNDIDRVRLISTYEIIDLTSNSLASVETKSEMQEVVASVWSDVLRNTTFGLDDNFFVLGGHSLSATRVSSRLTKLLDKHVPIRAIFETPTVRSLAAWIDADENKSELTATISTRLDAEDAPTTFTQQQLWILGQMFSGMAAYSIPSNIKFNGELNLELLQTSLLWIVDRHHILRTIFQSVDGEPRQILLETPKECAIRYFNLIDQPLAERDAKAKAIIRQEARRNWELERGPLFRCVVVSITDSQHIICTIFHHIIADGPSVGIFSRELERIYTGLVDGKSDQIRLPELKLQYSDYAYWERDSIQGDLFQKQLAYWRSKLDQSVPLEVPTDFPRPSVHNFYGKKVKFSFAKDDLLSIKSFCRTKGCTLFVFFVACYQYILFLYSGQDDVLIGTAMTNRVRSELEPLIGLFVNTLPIRTKFISDWTFSDLVSSVKTTCVEAFSNMELPFEETVNVIQPVRDLSKQGSPLFQHMIINQPPGRLLKERDSSFEPGESHHDTGYSNFDLLLSTHEIQDTRIDCTLAYDTELFREDTINRFIELFCKIVRDLPRHSDQPISKYKLVSIEQEKSLLWDWAGEIYDYPDHTILDKIGEYSKTFPDSIAISYGQENVNYRDLQMRVAQLATHFNSKYLISQKFVAVCLPKSIDAVVSILAVMTCRGIVVPLDPNSPNDRLNYILKDADIDVLISVGAIATELDLETNVKLVDLSKDTEFHLIAEDSADLSSDGVLSAKPEDAAYMIYTSGSTGRPKGVVIEHKNLTSTIMGQVLSFDIRQSDRVLSTLSLGFDAAFGEIFRCLYVGATLVLPTTSKLLPSQEMLELFVEHQITVVAMSASMLSALPEPNNLELFIRTLIVGGEACPASVSSRWKHRCQLINGYGPSETTIGATYGTQWPSNGAPPLGRPLPGVRIYVLDSNQNPVPLDIVGELYIGGNSVGRGYHNKPELTQEKFISDPFSTVLNSRMYKTGDRVKWRSDGQLEFVGRVDNQVKVRGYRVELGEVENAASSIDEVLQSGVTTFDSNGQIDLAMYVKLIPECNLNSVDIRKQLRKLLPEYMVPKFIIELETLPLNSSGKLDKSRLPMPQQGDVKRSTEFVMPLPGLETRLSELWASVLGVERVGRIDNFFELGGDSISCIRVSSRALELGFAIDPKLIFKNQTIQELAENLKMNKL